MALGVVIAVAFLALGVTRVLPARAFFKGRLENMGSPVLMMSPADFHNLIAEETERWAKVIKFAKIKPK